MGQRKVLTVHAFSVLSCGIQGGHVEKDLLMKLNIPWLDLETLGCPKYDKLRHIIPQEKLFPSFFHFQFCVIIDFWSTPFLFQLY